METRTAAWLVSSSGPAGGPEHVDPDERGLGFGLLVLALIGEGVVRDLELEVPEAEA